MRVSHQYVGRGAIRDTDVLKYPQINQDWLDKDAGRKKTLYYRMGGFGSMLAVSINSGAGTSLHYDGGDDAHFYSSIIVLDVGGRLQMPEIGLELVIAPGDLVCFIAGQQLHRLAVDASIKDRSGENQKVLTLWTDKNSMEFKNKATPDFYDDMGRPRKLPQQKIWVSKESRLEGSKGGKGGKGGKSKGKGKAVAEEEEEGETRNEVGVILLGDGDGPEGAYIIEPEKGVDDE